MSPDLRVLLEETAEQPSHLPDPRALVAQGRRRRQRRYAASAAAAALVLLAGGVAVLEPLSAPRVPEVADQPPGDGSGDGSPQEERETATDDRDDASPDPPPGPADEGVGEMDADRGSDDPASAGDTGPALTLADDGTIAGLEDAPERGVLVQQDGEVVLVDVDGQVHGHLEAEVTGAALASLSSTAHMPVVTVDGMGVVWLDPANGRWFPAHAEAPLYADTSVVLDVDQPPGERWRLLRGAGTEGEPVTVDAWPQQAEWWLSSNHRVVTWLPCTDGDCVPRMADTDMGAETDLPEGCWVAASVGDFAHTLLCEDGRQVVSLYLDEQDAVEVPDGTDGEPATATAVFDDVVRVEHATCDIVEPRLLDAGDALEPLLGPPAETPSAVPLDSTYPGVDGEVLLHYNIAACGGTAEVPGVYRFDRTSGKTSLVYEVAAGLDEVVAWRPGPPLR